MIDPATARAVRSHIPGWRDGYPEHHRCQLAQGAGRRCEDAGVCGAAVLCRTEEACATVGLEAI